MAKYRDALPQLDGGMFMTDGGMETTFVFHQNIDLPEFAAFDLLRTTAGTETIRAYFRTYLDIARDHGLGFVLETPTWRANPDWGAKIGYSPTALASINAEAVELMEELRDEYALPSAPIVVSGNIGPRDDAYAPAAHMNPDQAQAYHATQIGVFADNAVDLVTALTLAYADEATGIVRAAKNAGLNSVISFTVETDGRLPSGQTLADAIVEVDAATDGGPAYYMINCAHPTHFASAMSAGDWRARVRGLRANASRMSHAELDEAPELDEGDPRALGAEHRDLLALNPQISVLGGCCGTDHRHVGEIIRVCTN